MGPTASGKSDLALAFAHALAAQGQPSEIVSVDSAQIFRGMDIGTAKPDAATQALIPHHLIDIRDPAQIYSAAEFARDATQLIDDIRGRGALPLLVGGSMMYFRSLESGLSDLPRADSGIRKQISDRAAREGWPALHAELAQADPEAAARLHPNDSQRIQRALEVVQLSGRRISDLQDRARQAPRDRQYLKLALQPHSRAALHARIEQRLQLMFSAGFVDEVAALHARDDLGPHLPSIRSVGYRQVWDYLDGQGTLAEAQARALAATRQFAKRQVTWLRSEHDICELLGDPGAEQRSDVNFRPELLVNEALEYLKQWAP